MESPVDITKHIGDIQSKDRAELKSRLMHIVENTKYKMYSHRDNAHKYRYDVTALQSNTICGMSEKWESIRGNTNKKLIASKLSPIQSAVESKKHWEEVSEVIYQRWIRRN